MLQDGVTEIVKLENFSIFPPETGGWPVTAETWHDCGRELINFHKIRKGLQSDPEDWVEARKHCAAGDGQIDFIQSSENIARIYIRTLVLFLIRFSLITVHCLRFTVIVSTQSEKHLPCYWSSGASLNKPTQRSALRPNAPQYRRAAPSSSVGYWRAHPSPPGTDPPALENTRWEWKKKKEAFTSLVVAKVGCKHNQGSRIGGNQTFVLFLNQNKRVLHNAVEWKCCRRSADRWLFIWSNTYWRCARSS